jgi:hypothetical protein
LKNKTATICFVVRRTIKAHHKKGKRKRERRRKNLGWVRFCNDVTQNALQIGKTHSVPLLSKSSSSINRSSKPKHSAIIEYLASQKISFSAEGRPKSETGHFVIPKIFSLTERY